MRRIARWAGEHDRFAAIHLHRVAAGQLATAAGLDQAVHPHITPLDALLGLAAAGHQPLPLEVLIQLHRLPRRWS